MITRTGGMIALMAVGLMGGVQAQEADGESTGFFVSGGVGVNFLEELVLPEPPPIYTATWKFNPGTRLTVGVGYQLFQNSTISVAAAGETGLLYNSLDEIEGGGGAGTLDTDGDFIQVPFLAKVVLKFMPESRISPFIGAGGGGVYSQLDVDTVNGRYINQGGHETDPAVQGEAGVRYALNEEVGLGLSYKFLAFFPEYADEMINHSVSFVFSLAF